VRAGSVLLANKEDGDGRAARHARAESGAQIVPVDSEHNAVSQCFQGRNSQNRAHRLGRPVPRPESLAGVTPEQACAHPNWTMGRKISVDSATMMNKGLEVIEARWLFDLPAERIEVLIHPQSIVHSLVEFIDGSVLAQLSNPDMRVPIAHALGFPERIESGARSLDLGAIGQLGFERPDLERFPCLQLAYEALRAGGSAPAILNAANEVAVAAFLAGALRFTAIARVIADTLAAVASAAGDSLAAVLEADANARRAAAAIVTRLHGKAA
jgi:1-deoxy-D-xylulose-5-phosphate reductoisomerase